MRNSFKPSLLENICAGINKQNQNQIKLKLRTKERFMAIHKMRNLRNISPKPKEMPQGSQGQKLTLSINIHLTEFIYSSAP